MIWITRSASAVKRMKTSSTRNPGCVVPEGSEFVCIRRALGAAEPATEYGSHH